MTAMVYGYAGCSADETRQDIKRQERELEGPGVDTAGIFFVSYSRASLFAENTK